MSILETTDFGVLKIYRDRVRFGAERFDEFEADWAGMVDLDRLVMSDPEWCVAGQVARSRSCGEVYATILPKLCSPDGLIPAGVTLGTARPAGVKVEGESRCIEVDESWAILAELWTSEIKARRAA